MKYKYIDKNEKKNKLFGKYKFVIYIDINLFINIKIKPNIYIFSKKKIKINPKKK